MTKTTAAVLRDTESPLSVEEIEVGAPQEGELLVKIRGVGVCHTDISGAHGMIPLPLPTVLGHEGSGVVEAIGEGVEGFEIGDHVAISFDHCGECDVCTSGHPAYCEVFAALNYFGSRMDGTTTLSKGDEEIAGNFFGQSSFAGYAICSKNNAVKVDKDLPLELLGPLGCGLQTGAGSVMNTLAAKEGQSIAIFGLGGVGLGAVMAAKAVGCDPILAFDLNNDRIELAKELGATHGFNPSEHKDLIWDAMQVVAPGVDLSFDCVGHGPVIRQALEMLRSPGHCASVGFQGLENEITIDQGHLLLGRTFTGVIEGDADPKTFIPKLIQLYRDGKFPFDKLIKTYSIDQINEAFADSEAGKVIKPVIVFD
ncbi:Aryl-alcohol dehydrogenase [Paraconexibacter sp. AEG42_29]|uniref:Aryl-alcohol dehydrogenase n=1 Tax=Paraconexibacter sp. AEG42_29 TaxID=2997339 RepID=A0AAU7AQS1_9ACTN